VLALKKHSELTSVCINGQCPRSAESQLNSYHTLGLVSGIGFGVGLAGAAAGLLLYGSGESTDHVTRAASNPIQVRLAPNGFNLEGTF